jgi:hypothetical protein
MDAMVFRRFSLSLGFERARARSSQQIGFTGVFSRYQLDSNTDKIRVVYS